MDTTIVAVLLILGVIFGLVGAGLVVFGLVQRNKAKQAEKWPTLPGTVVASRIDSKTSKDYRDGHTVMHTTHMPVVEYTYAYMGKTYLGSRIFPGANMSFDQGTAQGIVNRYQPGQSCTVHYNPADLNDVVLESKSGGGNLMLILGAVFSVIGTIACCASVGFLSFAS